MRFLFHHPGLVILAGILSLLGSTLTFNSDLFKNVPRKWGETCLALLLSLFIVWSYLLPTTYYFPRNPGVVGDNYLYMSHVLNSPGYYIPHHLSYPWIPGKLIGALSTIGTYFKGGSIPRETAFLLSIIPIKLAMIFSLGCFFFALKKTGFDTFDRLLSTFFLAASSSGWLWGHQSNALGIGLAAEILSVSLFIIWSKNRNLLNAACLGMSMALCIYAHIATLFFVVGGYFYIVGSMCLMTVNKRVSLLAFHAPILLLAVIYYQFAALYAGSYVPHRIFVRLADTAYFGDFGFQFSTILKNIKDNLVSSVQNIVNVWDPHTLFDQVLIGFQMTLIFSLLGSLAMQGRHAFRQIKSRDYLLFLAFISLTIMIGFTARGAGTHYYAVATIPNAILIVLLMLERTIYPVSKILKQRIYLVALVGSMVIYSGYSTWNVFQGSDLNENEYYRASSDIARVLLPHENALYFRGFNFDYLNNAVRTYYEPRFNQTKWQTDSSSWKTSTQLVRQLKEAGKDRSCRIFLSDEVLQILRKTRPKTQATSFGADINLITNL